MTPAALVGPPRSRGAARLASTSARLARGAPPMLPEPSGPEDDHPPRLGAAGLGLSLDLLYDELRRVAGALMARERTAHTLQPTALVSEAWLRLAGSQGELNGKEHFLGLAARAMRRVLVDHARARGRLKRGGDVDEVPLDTALAWYEERRIDVLAVDEALERLRGIDPELVELVELRFFAGLTLDETAAALGNSVATVERGWKVARLWLARDLGLGHEPCEPCEP